MFAKAVDDFFRLFGSTNKDNTDKINALCNLLVRAIICRYSLIPQAKGEAPINGEKISKYCRVIRDAKEVRKKFTATIPYISNNDNTYFLLLYCQIHTLLQIYTVPLL